MISQYLARTEALLVETEWDWVDSREMAFVFGSHRDASDAARAHAYPVGLRGEMAHGWAIVLGAEEQVRRGFGERKKEEGGVMNAEGAAPLSSPGAAAPAAPARSGEQVEPKLDGSGGKGPVRGGRRPRRWPVMTPEEAYALLERRHLD